MAELRKCNLYVIIFKFFNVNEICEYFEVIVICFFWVSIGILFFKAAGISVILSTFVHAYSWSYSGVLACTPMRSVHTRIIQVHRKCARIFSHRTYRSCFRFFRPYHPGTSEMHYKCFARRRRDSFLPKPFKHAPIPSCLNS